MSARPVTNLEGQEISYAIDYDKIPEREFDRKKGGESFLFSNKELITKQNRILKYILSTIGSNLLSGTSVMNISLPVNIFDKRTVLEHWAFQHRLAPEYLEKAALEDNPIEKLKLVNY